MLKFRLSPEFWCSWLVARRGSHSARARYCTGDEAGFNPYSSYLLLEFDGRTSRRDEMVILMEVMIVGAGPM